MKGVSKTFGTNRALDKVDFELLRGEVHALLGENGAGKMTLMKVLGGVIQMDSGEILVKGKREEVDNPSKAMQLGIGIVHQHFSLIPTLTVYENFLLPNISSNRSRFRTSETKDDVNRIKEVAASTGLEVDVRARISSRAQSLASLPRIRGTSLPGVPPTHTMSKLHHPS